MLTTQVIDLGGLLARVPAEVLDLYGLIVGSLIWVIVASLAASSSIWHLASFFASARFFTDAYSKSLIALGESIDLLLDPLAIAHEPARPASFQFRRLVLFSFIMSDEELGGLVIVT